MIEIEAVERAFRERYGSEPRLFRAPGRVNLIGEHTDYNDGFVLPMAIDRGTVVAAAARKDRRVRVFSLNMNEQYEFDLDREGSRQRGIWLDYIEGVARSLEADGARLRGAEMAIDSDVPTGAGLSSSAALEVSTGFALLSLADTTVDRVRLALAGQRAEHEYVGTKVGIMDQMIAALGRRGSALLIDCRTFATTHIPVDTSQVAVVICDSHVKHELASSEYNTRRAECERGVELLRQFLPGIKALRDVSVADFEKYADRLPEVVRRRCRHVVTEDARTLQAAEALRAGRMEEMGRLMYESHRSLRDDYEVSCAELDTLVDIAARVKGVLGARMTGGGFGGCTVNLVGRGVLNEFSETITRLYREAYHIDPPIYVVAPENGAQEITAEAAG